MWHISRCTFSEMTRLILWFLFMIRIKPAAFFISPSNPHVTEPFSALIIYNTIISFHRRSTLKPKRTFFTAICHWYPLSNLLFTKGFPCSFHFDRRTWANAAEKKKTFQIPRFLRFPPGKFEIGSANANFFLLALLPDVLTTTEMQDGISSEVWGKSQQTSAQWIPIVSLQNAGHFFSPRRPFEVHERLWTLLVLQLLRYVARVLRSSRRWMKMFPSTHISSAPTAAFARLFYRIFASWAPSQEGKKKRKRKNAVATIFIESLTPVRMIRHNIANLVSPSGSKRRQWM